MLVLLLLGHIEFRLLLLQANLLPIDRLLLRYASCDAGGIGAVGVFVCLGGWIKLLLLIGKPARLLL